MPLNPAQVAELEASQSHYGCGNEECLACYPIQYACEFCAAQFPDPIANGEYYDCPECGWVNNEAKDTE